MPKCKSCDAEIRWAVTVNGKKIPIDAAPAAGGNITLTERPAAPSSRPYVGASGKVEDRITTRREQPPIAVMIDAEGQAQLPGLQPSSEAPRYKSHFATCPDAAKYREAGARPKV